MYAPENEKAFLQYDYANAKVWPSYDDKRPSRVTIVEVEGNIGAGKSRTLDYLAGMGLPTYAEPVASWMDDLTLYYENPREHAYDLQVKIIDDMRRRYEQIIDAFTGSRLYSSNIVVCERGLVGLEAFIKVAKRQGNVTFAQFELLMNRVDEIRNWLERTGVVNNFTIYVDVDVDKCAKRIKLRGRKCESNITSDYLRLIESSYREQIKSRGVWPRNVINGNAEDALVTRYDETNKLVGARLTNRVAKRIFKLVVINRLPRGIYYVDGISGAGKSTIIKYLNEEYGRDDDIDKYDGDVYDKNDRLIGVLEELNDDVVKDFYDDPVKNSVRFEQEIVSATTMKITRAYDACGKLNWNGWVFVERSPLADDAFTMARASAQFLSRNDAVCAIGARQFNLTQLEASPLLRVFYAYLDCAFRRDGVDGIKIRNGSTKRVDPVFFFSAIEYTLRQLRSAGITSHSLSCGDPHETVETTAHNLLITLYKRLT